MTKLSKMFAPLAIGLSCFALTSSALALTSSEPIWPDCAAQCQVAGPDGSANDPVNCGDCCDKNDACAPHGVPSSGNAQCHYCCTAYNGGDPNGPHHCQNQATTADTY